MRSIIALILLGGSVCYSQFPLPAPQRPSSFPLAAPTNSASVVSWNSGYDWLSYYGEGFVQISAGDYHVLGLRSDGTVWAWGWSMYGDNIWPPEGLADVVQIAAGANHSVALRSDGTVVCWGANWNGECSPPLGLDNVVQVDAGSGFSVALLADGTVVAWGASSQWSMWGGSYYVPPPPPGDVVRIAAGSSHILALLSDGTVTAWGYNSSSEASPPPLSDVVAITAGNSFSVALRSDGSVTAWGGGGYGETNIPPEAAGVVAISANSYRTLALRSNGTVVSWGASWMQHNVPSSLSHVEQVAAGNYDNYALVTFPPILGEITKVSTEANQPFADALQAYQGRGPFTWELIEGQLPPGIVLSADGNLSGTPVIPGSYIFGVRVTDSKGRTGEGELELEIVPDRASGGDYLFANLAGWVSGSFSGSSDDGLFRMDDWYDSRNGVFSGSADGTGIGAGFHAPSGVAVSPEGWVYVSDAANHMIRVVSPLGVTSHVVGAGFSGSADGWTTEAELANPQGLALDAAGNVFVAEYDNHRIRRVVNFYGYAYALNYAGSAGFSGSADGRGREARFNQPADVAVDAAGNVYVADSGNHAIRKIAANGQVTTVAGTMGASGYTDATGMAARFQSPQGVAVDAAGNIYVADTANCLIRRVSPGGAVTTVAGAVFTGSAGPAGRASFTGSAHAAFLGSAGADFPQSVDGPAGEARFSFPTDVEVDADGNIFVTDSGSSRIRKIGPDGSVTTIGGSPAGFFSNPLDITVYGDDLLVADAGHNRIALTIELVPEIALEGPIGMDLVNGAVAVSFGNFLRETASMPRTYRVRNVGYADLAVSAMEKEGTHSADFEVSGAPTGALAPGQSAYFTVTFKPRAGGPRKAHLSLASDDADESLFVVNLAGFGISREYDTDGDGLNDEAEFLWSGLGFDWEVSQPAQVGLLSAHANVAGFYTSSQFDANRLTGVEEGKAEVLATPSAFGLYDSNSIMDLRLDGTIVPKEDGHATVEVQMQVSPNLMTDPFTDYGEPMTHSLPMSADKMFLRITLPNAIPAATPAPPPTSP